MTVRGYPSYKNSGVGWLREIPSHWPISQSRRLFSLRNEGMLPSDRQLTVSQKHGVMYQDEFMAQEGQRVVQVLKGADILKHVEPDDFVISMRSFQGGIEWCRYRGCTSSAYVILTPGPQVDRRFFSYALKSEPYIQALRTTSNLVRDGQALRFDNFAQVPLPLPPIGEQGRIADFLDRETAKIDALVAEQTRLVSLLGEKRQVAISNAVTHGLDTNCAVKTTNVEWIGSVPSTWDVVRLKYVCDVQTGGRDTEHAVTGGRYPFFVRSQTVERIDTMSFDCEAVLTAGDGAGVGKVFHYYTGPFDFHQRVYMMNGFRRVRGEFLFHYLRENFYKIALDGGAKSTVDSLRRPMFTNFPVCVPPDEEQLRILESVRRDLAAFDALAGAAVRSMALLQERRTALVAAAVTGKMDVRDLSDIGTERA